MKGLIVPWAILAALTAAAALAVPAPTRADEWTGAGNVGRAPRVQVIADDGSIELEGGAGSRIEARVVTEGWRISPGGVRIKENRAGDDVRIQVRTPHRFWNGFDFDTMFHPDRRSIRVILRVPRRIDVDLRTSDGTVDVGSTSGSMHVRTADGDVAADDVRGEIDLATSDGRIEAGGLEGTLKASTADGSIDVQGTLDDLHLHTSDGNIHAVAEPRSRQTEAPRWDLQTVDGNVVVVLPEDLAFDVDAHTSDGGVDLDFPSVQLERTSGNTVRGRVNGGGFLTHARTSDGSIRIEPARRRAALESRGGVR